MPTQAIPLALVSSLYPLGLVALLLLFGATRPRARSVVFLIGAAVCLLTVGFIFVFVVRGAGLSDGSNSTPRYGLRLGLGVLFLVGAWLLARRPPKERTTDAQPSRISKAVAGSGLLAVFVVGLAMYTPSPTYLAALDVVGGTKMSTAATAAWVVIVVVLVLITIEVPVALYLVAPGWTIPRLQALNEWLDRNGRTLLVYVLAALGVWQVIDGLVGLL
jgi:Sap, sulfolipid-1-addressing protein